MTSLSTHRYVSFIECVKEHFLLSVLDSGKEYIEKVAVVKTILKMMANTSFFYHQKNSPT